MHSSFDKGSAQRQDSFGSDISEKDKVSRLPLVFRRHSKTRRRPSRPSRSPSFCSGSSADSGCSRAALKEFSRSSSSSWFKRSSTQSTDGGSKPSSPTVNVYTHCGRHTDQYLFGGHSIRELFGRKS